LHTVFGGNHVAYHGLSISIVPSVFSSIYIQLSLVFWFWFWFRLLQKVSVPFHHNW